MLLINLAEKCLYSNRIGVVRCQRFRYPTFPSRVSPLQESFRIAILTSDKVLNQTTGSSQSKIGLVLNSLLEVPAS